MTTERVQRPYVLEVRWDGRGESPVAEAARLATFLHLLANRDVFSERWYVSRGIAFERMDLAQPVPELVAALARDVEAWDYGPYHLTANKLLLENGLSGKKRVQLGAKVCIPKTDKGIWFANKVDLELFAPRETLVEPAALAGILDDACRTFSPAWACLGPPRWPVRAFEDDLMGVPKISWMTFLGAEYGTPAAVNEPAHLDVVPGTNGGHRIVAVPEWFSSKDDAHVRAVTDVTEQLRAAGALVPRNAPVDP